jgi:ketosteroid isomerase-like protein
MRRVLALALTVPLFAIAATAPPAADPQAPAGAELTTLLEEFLAGASRNDAAAHERFWGEDLIYTGSAGRRVGKADILRDLGSAPAPGPGDPLPVYTAEDIRIQPYGDTAIVAFRLVETTTRDGRAAVVNYLNTGTFVKRAGRWQAVAWQATRMPRPQEESTQAVTALHDLYHRALLAADVKALEAILDEGFVWTHDDGDRKTGRQLIEALGTGTLRYANLESSAVTVTLHGDTAVARGTTTRQRRVFPGSGPAGDAAPFTAFHTLTFVNLQGRWKAVALHTSRP